MLQLLLSLSSSENQEYDYIPKINQAEKKQTLTWEDVVNEDPLEGDHWQTWPEDLSSDDLTDEEDIEAESTPFREVNTHETHFYKNIYLCMKTLVSVRL